MVLCGAHGITRTFVLLSVAHLYRRQIATAILVDEHALWRRDRSLPSSRWDEGLCTRQAAFEGKLSGVELAHLDHVHYIPSLVDC